MNARTWRDTLRELDPEIAARVEGLVAGPTTPVTPQKFRELIAVANCTALRNMSGYQAHAKRAIDQGASNQELWEATLQGWTAAAFPPLLEVVGVFEKLMQR